jgi:hypothetical protein
MHKSYRLNLFAPDTFLARIQFLRDRLVE